MVAPSSRDRWVSGAPSGVAANIDTVRGLACLLVVALHVVGENATTGLHLPMSSPWHYAMVSLDFVRMPLFTALSGYLYAGQRVASPEFKRFWLRKLQRIGTPLICLTIIIWVLRRGVYHDTIPLLDAFLFSFGHLWYLQALLLLFLVISVLDCLVRPSVTSLLLGGFAIITVARSVFSMTDFFSIGGAIYLAPYFVFGVLLREKGHLLRDRDVGVLALGIVLIVLVSQQFALNGLAHQLSIMQLSPAIAGMAAVVVLLQRVPQNASLAAIGRFSYTIYLWHVVAGAATRHLLIRCGVNEHATLFALCFAVGVSAPVLLHVAVSRWPLLCIMPTGTRGVPRPHVTAAARPRPLPFLDGRAGPPQPQAGAL
ncbi:MAG TPA: acyltransferase [Rhodopila sp.]|nr:acyltransferase [Rhodopila sp.]